MAPVFAMRAQPSANTKWLEIRQCAKKHAGPWVRMTCILLAISVPETTRGWWMNIRFFLPEQQGCVVFSNRCSHLPFLPPSEQRPRSAIALPPPNCLACSGRKLAERKSDYMHELHMQKWVFCLKGTVKVQWISPLFLGNLFQSAHTFLPAISNVLYHWPSFFTHPPLQYIYSPRPV